MKKLLLFILFCSIGFACFAIEVELKYFDHNDNSVGYRAMGWGKLEKKFEFDAKGWKLPKLKSKLPVYCMVKIGDTERLMILDEKGILSKFYDVIYFDANGNKDLTDDPVVKVNRTNGGLAEKHYYLDFPIIPFKIQVEGKEIPYAFKPYVYCYSSDGDFGEKALKKRLQMNVQSACGYRGELNLDGEKYNIQFLDYNTNGRYDDSVELPDYSKIEDRRTYSIQTDNVYIARPGTMDYQSCNKVTEQIFVNGKLYNVNLDVTDKKLILEEVKDNLVDVKLPFKVYNMCLHSPDTGESIAIVEAEEKISIPSGKYKLIQYTTKRKDEKGSVWRLIAEGTNESSDIVVAENSEMKFGEPFNPQVYVGSYYKKAIEKGAKQINIQLHILGQNKEKVTYLSRISGNKSNIKMSRINPNNPKEPSFKIFDSKGKKVASDDFQYGWGFSCSATWSGPEKDEEYTAECEFQVGPFETKPEPVTVKF